MMMVALASAANSKGMAFQRCCPLTGASCAAHEHIETTTLQPSDAHACNITGKGMEMRNLQQDVWAT